MAINIQDNFRLNIAVPVDTRIVASGSVARDAISFKYDGLRVFDTSDRKSYVWNANTPPSGAWTSPDITGGGVTNTLARWETATGLTSSGVYFTSGKVGINTSNPEAAIEVRGISGDAKFVVHSYVGGVILAQNFYNNGSNQYFDYGLGSSAIRMNTSGEIEFLCRTANATALDSTGTNGNLNLMTWIDGPNRNTYLYTNLILSDTRRLPTTSALYLRRSSNFSTPASPDVTWYNNDQTGIYHPANNVIGFSINGSQLVRMTSTGLIVGPAASTSNRILINNTAAAATYLQATNTNATNGALFGLNSLGAASILSRGGPTGKPIVLGFANQNVTHKFDETTFQIYGFGNGVSGVSEAIANSVEGTRVLRGYSHWLNTNISAGQNAFIGSVALPGNCIFSMEITYTTVIDNATHFKVQKQLLLGRVDSSYQVFFHSQSTSLPNPVSTDGGSVPVTANPDGVLGKEIYKMSSSSGETNIGNGYIDTTSQVSNVLFEFYVRIKLGTNVTVRASANYVINIIDF